jgi:hypothetical protein
MKLPLATPLVLYLLGSPEPRPRSWLLDDFESKGHVAAHDLAWVGLGDDLLGGTSTIALQAVPGGASGSGRALRLEGSLGAAPAFTGAWAPLDGQGRPVDLSAFDTLRFSARGEGTFQAGLRSGAGSAANFMAPFTAGPEWKLVEIPFDRLALTAPGSAGARWDPKRVHWLGITTAPETPGRFRLEVDDVQLVSHRGGERPQPKAQSGPPRALRVSLTEPPASAKWRELARDPSGDAKKAALPDAVSIATAACGERVWFRIGLKDAPPSLWLGVNLALDVDGDAANGMAWWGVNTTFRFDRLVSVWLFKTGDTYQGVAGTTDAASATSGELMAGGRDVRVAIDRASPAFLVGVPRSVLGSGAGPVRLVAAVGSALAHNDDLPDEDALLLPR